MKSASMSSPVWAFRAIWPLMLGLGLHGGSLAQGPVQAGGSSAEPSPWRWHFQGGLNAVAERHLFWNLAELSAAGQGYDANKQWLESYVKPGLSLQHALGGGNTLHGKLSAVASYTSGTDAFAEGNTGAVTLEEAYLGWKGATAAGQGYEFSLGRRELKLGTGMLIASGASSGFERGP